MPGQTSKGNPAHHRMSNAALKARRERSWSGSKARKDARRKAQEAAHKRNLANGNSPWQQAQAERFRRRETKRAEWAKRQI